MHSEKTSEASTLKDRGNDLFKSGDSAGALQCYEDALEYVGGGDNQENDSVIASTKPIIINMDFLTNMFALDSFLLLRIQRQRRRRRKILHLPKR
jgi:hypothetical protein